jgi:hypothetical protein
VGDIKQIIVGSTNIDASELKTKIKEWFSTSWLNDQIWYSHDSGIPHVNYFGCLSLIKKKALDNSIILFLLNMKCWGYCQKKQGVAVVWNCNAKSFLQDKKNCKYCGIVNKCLIPKYIFIR